MNHTRRTVKVIDEHSRKSNGEISRAAHGDITAYKAAFNSLAEGVIIADSNGEFLFFNPAAERILGIGIKDISVEEWQAVYGCYYLDKTTPYDPRDLPLARVIQGEDRVEDELMFIKNDKKTAGVWIRVNASALHDSNGQCRGGIVIFRDVTEKRQTLEKLELFARAVKQTADSVLITDKGGLIEYVNPAFEKTSGYKKREVLGKSPGILKSGLHDDRFYRDMWNQILGGKAYRGTIINRKKNGQIYWSEQTITPIKDEGKYITHFVSVLKDVTDIRKQQEQEFQLSIAHEVQQRLYCGSFTIEGLDLAGAAFLAEKTGGDYYDFFRFADGTLAIAVGDVTGHGISAALIMAETRAYLRAFAKVECDPAKILTMLNQELCTDLGEEHFVTMVLAKIDTKRRIMDYANAGHEAAQILGPSGDIESVMESTGIPLGFICDYTFSNGETHQLRPGNIAVFLTDGITEAESTDEVQFGLERAIKVVSKNSDQYAEHIVQSLYHSVRNFSQPGPQEDDITSVVCKINESW